MKWKGVVYPRPFTITVEADDFDEALDEVHKIVCNECVVCYTRNDNSYNAENLLDDFDVEMYEDE